MIPQSGLSTTARLPIDIRRFPWIRRLPGDYAFAYDNLAEFFAGNPGDPGAWRDAIARVRAFPRDRAAVADMLGAQQRQREAAPEALAATDDLRSPDTVAVVTGQQAGLFGGPFFTLLKALTAIGLAERVRREYRIPAVALFWIDAEDHDWDEVRSCGVLDDEMAFQQVSLGSPSGAREKPVADVVLDDSVSEALAALQQLTPSTEFTPALIQQLQSAYRPGLGMARAFGRWLESVLGSRGLIVFDAADPASKPLVAGVFAREIEHAGDTTRLATHAGNTLQARGYHAQVTPQEGSLALFHLDGGRQSIRVAGDEFRIGETSYTKAALLDRVTTAPHEFSPNVLLRPIVEDRLFPTVCYVAGPSELAYQAQLGAVYEAFGVPRPLIQLRTSATVLDSNAMRFLQRHDIQLDALRAQDEAALNQLLESQLPPSVEASLRDATLIVQERMDAIAREVPQIDPTLEAAARSTSSRMQDDLKKLQNKIIQASKRKNDTLRRQFIHAQAQAFPRGHPQEREVGFVYFLNKYGPGLIDRLSEDLPLDMGMHWVMTV